MANEPRRGADVQVQGDGDVDLGNVAQHQTQGENQGDGGASPSGLVGDGRVYRAKVEFMHQGRLVKAGEDITDMPEWLAREASRLIEEVLPDGNTRPVAHPQQGQGNVGAMDPAMRNAPAHERIAMLEARGKDLEQQLADVRTQIEQARAQFAATSSETRPGVGPVLPSTQTVQGQGQTIPMPGENQPAADPRMPGTTLQQPSMPRTSAAETKAQK